MRVLPRGYTTSLVLFAVICGAVVPARAGPLFFAVSSNYVYNGSLTFFQDVENNGLFATAGGTLSGITVSASANLSTGTLKMSNAGSVSGSIDAAAQALVGDTITASGAIGGLNLGVNININGSVTDSNSSNNSTTLVVDALPLGAFNNPSGYFTNILWSAAYALGPNSTPLFGWPTYAPILNGSYGNGSYSIPLSIPFSTLGSSFQLVAVLESYEIGSGPATWTTDYSDTMTVSLSAPRGVTLQSYSGLPGTVAATPEPGTAALLLAGFAALAALVRPLRAQRSRKRRECAYGLDGVHCFAISATR